MPPIVQVSISHNCRVGTFASCFGWVLNNLLQIGDLKKGRFTWHSFLAHCFPDDMHYVLSFGYLFPVVTGAFHFFLC